MKLTTLAAIALTAFSLNAVAATSNPQQSAAPQTEDAKNLQVGSKFLADNKSKPGVLTTADGLQYKVIKAGTGAKPSDIDIVTVNYEGRLIDGTVFDSSYNRGEPAKFPVGGVIPGWVEALKMMNVGSVWELYIPAELAYGEAGAPPSIGPNETLIFKVELLGIDKS